MQIKLNLTKWKWTFGRYAYNEDPELTTKVRPANVST